MTATTAMQISFCFSVVFWGALSAGLMMWPEKQPPSPTGLWSYVYPNGQVLLQVPGRKEAPVTYQDSIGNIWITNRFEPWKP